MMDRDNWKYYININLSVINMQKQKKCVMRLIFIRINLDDISIVYSVLFIVYCIVVIQFQKYV